MKTHIKICKKKYVKSTRFNIYNTITEILFCCFYPWKMLYLVVIAAHNSETNFVPGYHYLLCIPTGGIKGGDI